MSTDNPEDWVDLVGMAVLAFAGVASSVLPTWFMKRKGKGGAEKDTNVSDDEDKVLNGLAADLDDLLAQVTQLRRSATNHFGESALADSVVEKLRKTAFDSEERIKDAIRAVHRDVRQCAKDLDK
jgi:hypothetical protein